MGINLDENELNSLQTDLQETLDASQKLEDALCEEDDDVMSSASSVLNRLTAKLGLEEWLIDDAKLSKKTDLKQCLQDLKSELSRYSQSIDSKPLSDGETIAQASGGSALCGVYLGNMLNRTFKPVLAQPTECSFINPSSGFVSNELLFASVEEASDFRKTMNTTGKSYALGLNGSIGFIHGGISGKYESNKTKQEEVLKASTTKSLAHVTFAYVPMKSLNFSKSLMNISHDAKQAVSDIEDENGALSFLEEYGSHVSCGEYQLGGVFWKVVEMTASKETSVTKMLEKCHKHMFGGLSVGYRSLGYGFNIDCRTMTLDDDKEISSTDNQSCTVDITTKIECVGPNALSYELFRRTLEVSKQSWHLIDRQTTPTTLVPVWEIVAKDSQLAQKAELLRDVWLKKAQKLESNSWLQILIQRARVKAWLGDPQFGTQNKNKTISSKEDAELIVRQEISRVCALDFSSSSCRFLCTLAPR